MIAFGIAAALVSIAFLLLAIGSQIALLTVPDPIKLQRSLQLWFGQLGLVFVWLVVLLIVMQVFTSRTAYISFFCTAPK